MRSVSLIPFLCLICGGAMADQPTAEEAAILPRILSAMQVELVEDSIGLERAVLLRSAAPESDMADLIILAGNPDEQAGEVLLVVRDLVWAGQMAGQVPWMEISPQRSLLVRSEQIGAGRGAWENTLTLAERDGDVLVAGYTLVQWDRITTGSAICDWNLLTGHWTMTYDVPSETGPGRTGETSGQRAERIALTDWNDRSMQVPDFCQVDLSE